MKKLLLGLLIVSLSLITSTYAQEVPGERFSLETAKSYQKSLKTTIQRIEDKLANLDALFPSDDPEYDSYLLSRNDMTDIISDMKQTVQGIGKDLSMISKYQEDLATSSQALVDLRQRKAETTEAIERLTRLLYQLHNEIYDQGLVDEIKLFTKMDNITDAANQEIYMELLIKQLNTLMGELNRDTQKNTAMIKLMYENKNNLERHIGSYQSHIENIERKVAYLESYMQLLQDNKEAINQKINDVVNTRLDIESSIITLATQIQETSYQPTWDREYQYNALLNLPNHGAEDVYTLSRPVLPIQYIKRYFNDSDYQAEYGIPHQGIRINIPQGQAIHAARDGVVVRTVSSELGINRITLAHTDGYMTSYLYVSDIFVKEGQIIRKGQVIARSGGERGTQGAGFFSPGANITFLVTKGGRFIDPLTILDLSAIDNEKMIPDELVFKYRRDIQRRPIDLTKLTMMEGESERERQIDFLQTYAKGVFQSVSLREQAGEGHAIDPSFVMCIGFAESTLGHYLTTANNMGNVGNPDNGAIRTNIDAGPLAGIAAIYDTLDNRYLGHYNRIDELSRYRREDKTSAIYASSTFNRQNNVLNCLTRIKGYHVPEDYAFRTGPRTAVTNSFQTTSTSQRGR